MLEDQFFHGLEYNKAVIKMKAILFLISIACIHFWTQAEDNKLQAGNQCENQMHQLAPSLVTPPLLGFSGRSFIKRIRNLWKRSQPSVSVIVLSGSSPENPLVVEGWSLTAARLRFRKAYNKGQFTEDEIYIDSISTRHGRPFVAKIIGLKTGTVVADIVHASGRIERRALNTYELENAEVSALSKKQLASQLNKIDATVFSKSSQESTLQTQGLRDVFTHGVDDMHQLQAVGERLRAAHINPFRTHIVDFANKVEAHIQFIREGVIVAREALKDIYKEEVSRGHNYYKSEIKKIDEQLKEDLQILEGLAQEARKKIKEEKVTYAWWLHWNNRLSVWATIKLHRNRVIDGSRSYWSPEEKGDIRKINENWWKTEENFSEYLDGEYYTQRRYLPLPQQLTSNDEFNTSVGYIDEAIQAFPDRIHLPTIEPYGIIAINESVGSHIFPSGLVAQPAIADGGFKNADEFLLHDLNEFTNRFKTGGLILNRDFNTHFRREVENLNTEEREKVETVFFAIWETPGVIDNFNYENISAAMMQAEQRFRNDKDLGAFLPVGVNMRSEESIREYLQSSLEVFISVSDRALQAMNQ